MGKYSYEALFDSVREAWWSNRQVSAKEACRSFDGLRDFMKNIASAAGYDAKTEPLIEKTLLEAALNAQETWATNDLFRVVRTALDTYHLYAGHVWLYCASNMEDLQGELQRRYNQRLRENFDKYNANEVKELYDVYAPVWHELKMEAMDG